MTATQEKTSSTRGASTPADHDAFDEVLEDLSAGASSPVERPELQPEKLTWRQRRAARKAARRIDGAFADHPHLVELKPRESYLMKSDYFEVDGDVASILSFFHDDTAVDRFPAFWGVSRIPRGMPDSVTTILLDQVSRMGADWIDARMATAERVDKIEHNEAKSGSRRKARTATKGANDLNVIASELMNGASYLNVHMRLMVKAPDLESLDLAIDRIMRQYSRDFSTLTVAPYHAEQRQEMRALTARNNAKRGAGQYYTSTEYAGAYSLVTNGLDDPGGEFIGHMVGDLNTSAVIFDIEQGFDHHVVISDDTRFPHLGRPFVPDLWGSKIGQSALMNNQRCVHLVLNGADIERLGPPMRDLTTTVDLNHGDVNPFEVFGERKNQLSLYPSHVNKLRLMALELYEATDSERGVFGSQLSEVLQQFYVDARMWRHDAQDNPNKLRLVGIPHSQVPRLRDFVAYLQTQYRTHAGGSGMEMQKASEGVMAVRDTFKNLREENGDLFDVTTKDSMDGVTTAPRVVYNFTDLLQRGRGVAMAQLVNVFGFAVSQLGYGDTLIIHGVEQISDSIRGYISEQLDRLFDRGGRVAYLYSDVEKMLKESDFNDYGRADWTILGTMTTATSKKYQDQLQQSMPPQLMKEITRKGSGSKPVQYLRRGVTNVVFRPHYAAGLRIYRKKQWREILGDEWVE